MTNPIRLGTGASPVALARARTVAGRLGAEIVTVGRADATPSEQVGLLREALRAGDIDAAVHDYVALPLERADGIVVAAVPKRGDARDALCAPNGAPASGILDALAAGARVGTDTALRRAQLLGRHPELQIVDLTGGLEQSRALLAEVDDTQRLAAVLTSAADVELLGQGGQGGQSRQTEHATEALDLSGWPPAPAQGALAIETLAADAKRVAKLEHRTSRLTTDAERAVGARLASAGVLFGASALLDDGLLFLSARVYSADGSRQLTSAHALYPEDARDPSAELAERVADQLLAEGARELGASGGVSA